MPTSKLSDFINHLPTAMERSEQWKWERRFFAENVTRLKGVDRTDCVNFFVPKDRNHDISVTMMVGYEAGLYLMYELATIRV